MLNRGEILKKEVAESLSRKNDKTYCFCGFRQRHSIKWCNNCGKPFSEGYTPETMGDAILFLIDKPSNVVNVGDVIKFFSAVWKYSIGKRIEDVRYNEIEEEVRKQLNIMRS